jgi:hypothetical protein
LAVPGAWEIAFSLGAKALAHEKIVFAPEAKAFSLGIKALTRRIIAFIREPGGFCALDKGCHRNVTLLQEVACLTSAHQTFSL